MQARNACSRGKSASETPGGRGRRRYGSRAAPLGAARLALAMPVGAVDLPRQGSVPGGVATIDSALRRCALRRVSVTTPSWWTGTMGRGARHRARCEPMVGQTFVVRRRHDEVRAKTTPVVVEAGRAVTEQYFKVVRQARRTCRRGGPARIERRSRSLESPVSSDVQRFILQVSLRRAANRFPGPPRVGLATKSFNWQGRNRPGANGHRLPVDHRHWDRGWRQRARRDPSHRAISASMERRRGSHHVRQSAHGCIGRFDAKRRTSAMS